jgi:hypothetical protein
VLRDEDSVYDIWPMSEKLLNASKSPVDLINSTEFSFAIQEALVIICNLKFMLFV